MVIIVMVTISMVIIVMAIIVMAIMMKELKTRITTTTTIVLSLSQREALSQRTVLSFHYTCTHILGQSLKMCLVRAFLLLFLVIGTQSAPKSQRGGLLCFFNLTRIIHNYKSYWHSLGPFRYPRGAQKGDFWPKTEANWQKLT